MSLTKGAGGITALGSGTGEWWLAGDIDPATVVAVYQPAAASDLASSLLDVSGNGNHATGSPGWVAGDGWNSDTVTTPAFTTSSEQWSVAIRYKGRNQTNDLGMIGGVSGLRIRDRRSPARYYFAHNPSSMSTFVEVSAPASLVAVLAYGRGYLDGTLVLETGAAPLTAGKTVEITGDGHAGYGLMYAAFYKAATALTAEQVTALTLAMASL